MSFPVYLYHPGRYFALENVMNFTRRRLWRKSFKFGKKFRFKFKYDRENYYYYYYHDNVNTIKFSDYFPKSCTDPHQANFTIVKRFENSTVYIVCMTLRNEPFRIVHFKMIRSHWLFINQSESLILKWFVLIGYRLTNHNHS